MPSYRPRIADASKLHRAIDSLFGFLAEQPLQEAAYYVSCVYAGLCDTDLRRDFAMFFTPPALARHIVEQAERSAGSIQDMRLMDPACGGAAFLLPAVAKLRSVLRSNQLGGEAIVQAVNRQVVGIERDRTLAELSRQFIRLVLAAEIKESQVDIGPIIRRGSTLELLRRGGVPQSNVVLCNPPYRKIKASELAWYRQYFPDAIALQPNLYSIFMHVALRLVVPGGVVALLTPTSYFSGPSYEPIRRVYTRRTSLERIDLVHERDNLFLGVEHDVAALFARRRVNPSLEQKPQVAAWNERTGWTDVGEVTVPKNGEPWLLPRDAGMSRVLDTVRRGAWSLKDYGYRARVGVYVWNRDKRKKVSARPKAKCRERVVPVVWATQIGQDGKFHFVSRSRKERRARYVQLRPGDRRGVIDRDCVVLQRTSSRAQRRRLVAAALPRGFARRYGGFVGENHVIVLEPTEDKPSFPLGMMARLLNSELMRDLYSASSGTTAVTTTGLHALPLPDPHVLKGLLKDKVQFDVAVRECFAPHLRRVGAVFSNAQAASSC
jgi:adenine-specific DNA-methyltransferase